MVAPTHFDKALEATRKGHVAAKDVAMALEDVGMNMKHGTKRGIDNQLQRAQARLLDLRIIVSDLEAHLRLSDAAEEKALSK